jgi:hypothetical protein
MRTLLIASALALSCTTTRPEEMTATEHRNAAQLHEQEAQRQREMYNPGLTREVPVRSPFVDSPDRYTGGYNPTADHLQTADREMRAAADHLRAARRLELFEDARCKDIAPEVRSACPLLASSVEHVTEVPAGVVLYLKPGVDAVDTHRRLDCHLAYAQTEGFARPSCPLFVKGVNLSLELAPKHAINFFSDDPLVAEELKLQARRIFLGVSQKVSER